MLIALKVVFFFLTEVYVGEGDNSPRGLKRACYQLLRGKDGKDNHGAQIRSLTKINFGSLLRIFNLQLDIFLEEVDYPQLVLAQNLLLSHSSASPTFFS